MENIDIFDANLQYIGIKERQKAHILGLWHKTFHLWLVSSKQDGQILYQWRSKEMKNFPDMLDVSAAGHLTTGENLNDGIRETEEELGIQLTINDIHYLGYRVEVADQNNGQKNREYQGVHIAKTDLELSQFNPQIEEVSGLYWISIKEGIDLFLNKRSEVYGHGIKYDEKIQSWVEDKRKFTNQHFLPRIQQYYLTIHIMAERLLENKFPLSIS